MQLRNSQTSMARTLATLPIKAALRVREKGLVDTLQRSWEVAEFAYGDWRLGIRAAGYITWYELGHDAECLDYDPISHRSFRRVLGCVSVRPDEDVFLDYGCGMGRALIMAAQRPFRRIIGVEKSAELCVVARENLRRARRKLHGRNIVLANADARCYELPDDVSVIYLFNPFSGQTLAAAIQRISASLLRRPRPLTILYVYPSHVHNQFARCDWLNERTALTTEGLHLVVYEPSLGNHSVSLEAQP